ncbi:MAG: hypothetical protein ABSD29_24895 [Verrucomicrobiota bacterium]
MTFTFEGAPRGTVQNVGVYYESGMSFGAAPGNVVLNGGGIPGYPDDGTGYLQMPDGNVDFFFTNTLPTRYFNLVSLDLAAYNTSSRFPGTFEIVGYQPMAGTVTNYFTLTTPLPGFQTFNLDATFTNLFQVDIFGANAPFSMDNVVINGVPEPSCGALALLGVAGAFWFVRASRRHHA